MLDGCPAAYAVAVDAIAATVLPAPYEFVSKHPRRRLLRPRPLNQAGKACTLAIKLESFAYITGRRRRLPRLRSTSGLPVASVGTVVSSSSKTPLSSLDFVVVAAVPELVRAAAYVRACCGCFYARAPASPWSSATSPATAPAPPRTALADPPHARHHARTHQPCP